MSREAGSLRSQHRVCEHCPCSHTPGREDTVHFCSVTQHCPQGAQRSPVVVCSGLRPHAPSALVRLTLSFKWFVLAKTLPGLLWMPRLLPLCGLLAPFPALLRKLSYVCSSRSKDQIWFRWLESDPGFLTIQHSNLFFLQKGNYLTLSAKS